MENASKALLMAASILLSVMILSLVVYLFATFGARASETHNQVQEQQMIQFNSQFTVYENRNDLKIHDIITVANLAKENNEKNIGYADFDNSYKITIYVNGLPTSPPRVIIPNGLYYDGIDRLNSLLSIDTDVFKDGEGGEVGSLKILYESSSVSYHDNGRVSQMTFTRVEQ